MTNRRTTKKQKPVRDPAVERLDRAFKEGLAKVEDLAKERILKAPDPFRTGLLLAREIRRVADAIDADVIAQCMDVTEAGGLYQEASP